MRRSAGQGKVMRTREEKRRKEVPGKRKGRV
jgi:hypothetical protein